MTSLESLVKMAVGEVLGFTDATLIRRAVDAIDEKATIEHITDRLSAQLDSRRASRVASKVLAAYRDFCVTHEMPVKEQRRKRRFDDQTDHLGPAAQGKAAKIEHKQEQQQQQPGAISREQIDAMMANAQRVLQQRKRELAEKTATPQTPGPQQFPLSDDAARAQALAALQARIASRLDKVNLPAQTMQPALPDRPTPVILDAEGRTVDAQGHQIQLSQHVPTLKANIRAKTSKNDVSAASSGTNGASATSEQGSSESKFFDSRVATAKTANRSRRSTLKFNEPGKFVMEGQRLRMKARLEQLQAGISSIARKTGIASATQLAKLVPKEKDKRILETDIEWWDALIMQPGSSYDDFASENANINALLREGAITNLIEHPIQMMPLEPTKPLPVQIFLTKKERKKLRRQNRREAWKEKQDKIRLGLIPPDEPKVKMSNLMRALGSEAVQDPTKVEAMVRSQMAARMAKHEKTNADRKLTADQKREKAKKKIEEDTSCGVFVAVFRVKSLANPAKRFKVETNAKQLMMTGTVVLFEDLNVVVVEGGPKQRKRFKHLMLNRIKWADETYKDKDGQQGQNECHLVWEGQTKERVFGELRIKQCPTEAFARDFFKKHNVEHYWDQAYSAAVLQDTEEQI